MSGSTRRRAFFGGVLVIAGGLLLLGKHLHLSDSIWLIGLGAFFLIGYFSLRSYGLLIPGGILAGLGVGHSLGASDLGLGLGFISIFVIDTLVYRRATGRAAGTSHWWPLIPGVIITGDAVADRYPAFFGSWAQVMSDWWPLLLVIVGAVFLLQPILRKGGKD